MKRINVFISQGSKKWAHNLDDLLERWRERKDNNNHIIHDFENEKNQTYGFINELSSLQDKQIEGLLFDLFERREKAVKQIPQGKLKTLSEKEKRIQAINDIKIFNKLIDYVLTEKNKREKRVRNHDYYHNTQTLAR